MSRRRRARAAVLAAILLAGFAASGSAPAQTTVNPQALDQLAPSTGSSGPVRHPRTTRPERRATSRTTHPATAGTSQGGGKPNPHAALPGTLPAKPSPAKPSLAIPAAPPPAPVLPPPIVVPTRPVPPPPPVPVAADAPGEATPQADGLRVTFGAGRSDLNPATDAAVRSLAHAAPPFAATTFTVTAYAAGDADDPSTPRRLALARGLAVRSVLITEGIPSTRIYVRALGASAPPSEANPAGAPSDRVDIVAATPKPASQPAGARPP